MGGPKALLVGCEVINSAPGLPFHHKTSSQEAIWGTLTSPFQFTRSFECLLSFDSPPSHHPQSTDAETEAQRGCPRSRCEREKGSLLLWHQGQWQVCHCAQRDSPPCSPPRLPGAEQEAGAGRTAVGKGRQIPAPSWDSVHTPHTCPHTHPSRYTS